MRWQNSLHPEATHYPAVKSIPAPLFTRSISGALVDGFPQCLLRCGHATTVRAQTNTGRPIPGIAVRSFVGNHTASQRFNRRAEKLWDAKVATSSSAGSVRSQSTPKQLQRATLKAQRRARNVPPTVEAYERVAASGPTRLIETLIGRHSTRIDNLDAVAQLSMDHCLGPLVSVCQLDAIFIRQGHQLNQHSPPHESPWPTHLSWSVESTIAALRLMLAGQIVGAAIILRQQLGRWTLLLARAGSVVRRRREPIESFIARAWTQRAMDKLGLYAFDVALDDIFDDLDDHPRTTGAIDTDHEHVPIDGRALCPAHVYHTLCELIDAQHADQRVECEVIARPRRRALTDRYKRSGPDSLRYVGAVHDSDATRRSNNVRLHKRPRRDARNPSGVAAARATPPPAPLGNTTAP